MTSVPAAAITFYSLVLWVHISSVVLAFGTILAYPLVVPAARRGGSMVSLHRLQVALAQRVVNPGLTLVLLSGIYLVARSPAIAFSDWWVSFGLAAVVVIGALVGSYLIPRQRRLAEEETSREGAGPSARGVLLVQVLVAVLVLATVLVMVVGSRSLA